VRVRLPSLPRVATLRRMNTAVRYRLRRRGIDHGFASEVPRSLAWARAEPEVLRAAVRPSRARKEIAQALRLLDRLRVGEDLASLVELPRGFRFAGTTVSPGDPLELHKLHVVPPGRARELYVKANWLSTHPRDGSMRLRFSYGAEILDDWLDDPASARATLGLLEGTFPACRLTTRDAGIARAIRRRLGRGFRFVQPIVYSNTSGGGALMHHDYVPAQAGVCFTQLAGRTGWLALPKAVLARQVQEHTGRWRDTAALLAGLESHRAERLRALINEDGAFSRRLAASGWFFALAPGDAILLPSHTELESAWHSVFSLSEGENLALSCGIVGG